MKEHEHAAPQQEPASGEALRTSERFFAQTGEVAGLDAGTSNVDGVEAASLSLGLLHATHDVAYTFPLSPAAQRIAWERDG